MKGYLITLILLTLLLFTCIWQYGHIGYLNNRLDTSIANETALSERLSGAQNDMVVYSNTIINLKHSQDSITKELMTTKKKLKIKDKELVAMGSINSSTRIHDTLRLYDTLLAKNICLDTVISDRWHTIRLGIHYPDSLYVGCEVESLKDVFITKTRETVEPPKRFFIFRWLQRRNDVIRVKVDEKNPYVVTKDNVFIRVLDGRKR